MQDAEHPDELPSDDDSMLAVWGDLDDRQDLDVAIMQEEMWNI